MTWFRAAPVAHLRLLSRLAVFAAWLALVVVLSAHHAVWRDEVRALSLALQGDGIADMLRGVQGEGHPAIWYLLLRGAHFLLGSAVALNVVAIAAASAAALILLFLSPFPLWAVVLLLANGVFLFEYSVSARNYGISIPLMLLFAHFYPTHKRGGLLLGILLALLCNTNVHSVILAGGFMLFWMVDLLAEQGMRWTAATRCFLLNGTVAALGVLLCFVTVYPPVHDAVGPDASHFSARALATAILVPASSFVQMTLREPSLALGLPPISSYPNSIGRKLMSLLLVGSTLALMRVPGALLAALTTLFGLSLFFVTVNLGSYRHEALWLMFLISLYWIVSVRGKAGWAAAGSRAPVRWLARLGTLCLLGLAALQLPGGLAAIVNLQPGHTPFSRVRDLAALIRSNDEWRDAIVIADPDFMLEALPYYANNRIYLLREQRFGKLTRFTNEARISLDLDDILGEARRLQAQEHAPVLIALAEELDPAAAPRTVKEGYNLKLVLTPAQITRFLAATERLARLRPAIVDEEFDVYRLKP